MELSSSADGRSWNYCQLRIIHRLLFLLSLCGLYPSHGYGFDPASDGDPIGLILEPMVSNYLVLRNLPDQQVDIESSQNLTHWQKVYTAIAPDSREVTVRGFTANSRFWRVVPAEYVKPPGRILKVSTESTDGTSRDNRFMSLGEAFKDCRNGDTIEIEEGEYDIIPVLMSAEFHPRSPLELHHLKDVTIRGIGDVRISGTGPGTYLHIRGCENLTIDNISFLGDRPDVPENPIQLFTTVLLSGYNNHLTFRKCQFDGFGNHGISQLHDPRASRHVLIEDCTFSNGGDSNVSVLIHDGAAISGIGSKWIVQNNLFTNCNRGIEVEGAFPGFPTRDVRIESNRIYQSDNIGIMIFTTMSDFDHYRDIQIVRNTIVNSDVHHSYGIALDGGMDISIRENYIEGAGLGIWVPPAKDLIGLDIAGNVITECGSGVFIRPQVYQKSLYDLTGNLIHDNLDFGVILFGGDGLVQGNSFSGNGQVFRSSGDLLVFTLPWSTGGVDVSQNRFLRRSESEAGLYNIVFDPVSGFFKHPGIDDGFADHLSVAGMSWQEFLNSRLDEVDEAEESEETDETPGSTDVDGSPGS